MAKIGQRAAGQWLLAISGGSGVWTERLRHPNDMFASATTRRRAQCVLGLILAAVVIYLAFWTTPVNQIPSNAFDEPEWLYSSFCDGAILPLKQPDVCQGMNTQTTDFSPTSKYIIALARWTGGVPANAVKYYYHIGEGPHEPLSAEIRAAIVHFMIGVSTLSLLIVFMVLWRLYGFGPALTVLALLVLTPYWRFSLRGVMADPGAFFFAVLAWAGTLWLVHLLLRGPRCAMGKILFSAACIGACIGFGINARSNAALLGVGFVAALVSVGIQTRTQWLSLMWAASIAFLATACCWLALGVRLSWHASISEQVQTIYLFNTVVPFGMLGGSILTPVDSLRDVISSVFGLSYFMVIPALASVPLCLIGIGRVFVRAGALGRTSGFWLLAVAVANLLANPVKIVPISWDRYATFFVFAVCIFMGIGIWHVGEVIFGGGRERLLAPGRRTATIGPLPPRGYPRSHKISAGICLVGAAAIAGGLVLSVLQAAPQGRLWKAFITAPTVPAKMDALSEMLERNPQARVLYNADQYIPDNVGQPVSEVLARYFQANVQSDDPNTLRAVGRAGHVLLTSSDDADLRARIQYDLGQLGAMHALLSEGTLTLGSFANDLPAALVPQDWKRDTHELLVSAQYPIHTAMHVPRDGSYLVTVSGLNARSAPITVGVIIDALPVGTLVYDHGDDSWTSASVVADLKAGSHQVAFQLLADLTGTPGATGALSRWSAVPTNDSGICRDARVPVGDPIAAGSCTTGMPPVVLDRTQTHAVVTVTAPIPALYDLALAVRKSDARGQRIAVAVDGRRLDGVLSLNNFGASPYSSVRLSPVYLTKGAHAIEIVRIAGADAPLEGTTVTLMTLSMQPRYPDAHMLPPARFGTVDPGAVVLRGRGAITASWQWYGHNFSFYQFRVLGSTDSPENLSVEVSVDNQVVGVTTLSQDGRLPEPLTVELANGATHTMTVRPLGLEDGRTAIITLIDFKGYRGPPIFSSTSMHWAKGDNRAVQSEGSTIHLPARARLTRTVTIATARVYTITARVRRRDTTGGTVALHLDADGWDVGTVAVQPTSDWTEETLTTYLPPGAHDLQFWWDAGTTNEPLDMMYFIVQ